MSLAMLARKSEAAAPPAKMASGGLRIVAANSPFEQEADRAAESLEIRRRTDR